MNTNIRHNTSGAVFLALIFALTLGVTIAACGSSKENVTGVSDLSNIPAFFGLSQVLDESQSPEQTRVSAGAIFYEKGTLNFIEFTNGEVEIEDPQKNVSPLSLKHDPFGAPYYNVDLSGPIALGQAYIFRVILANGVGNIDNFITTPAQNLQITAPEKDATINKAEPLPVAWTGTSSRPVQIYIRPQTTTIFNLFQAGMKAAQDDGTTTMDPADMTNVSTGSNLLTVMRSNTATVTAFDPSSRVGAFLVDTRPVEVQ